MIAFIEECRDEFGVGSICSVLPIAPSSYDAQLAIRCDSREIRRLFSESGGRPSKRPRSGRSKMRATAGKSGVSSAKAAAVTVRVRFGMRCVGKATTSPGSHGGKADER
jgi:hypothetical protein